MPEHGRHQADVGRELRPKCAVDLGEDGAARLDRRPELRRGGRGDVLARTEDHLLLLSLAEPFPCRHLGDEREAVGESRVEGLRTAVGVRFGLVVARGRVHRRPAVKQALEEDALDAALVHDREELVLQVGPAARDLVEENRLRVPDRRRGADEAEASLPVRQRVADQVVVVEETRVVVPPLEPERGGDAAEEVRLPGPVRPDEEQRLAADQRAQHHGLDRFHADHAEASEQRAVAVLRHGRPLLKGRTLRACSTARATSRYPWAALSSLILMSACASQSRTTSPPRPALASRMR